MKLNIGDIVRKKDGPDKSLFIYLGKSSNCKHFLIPGFDVTLSEEMKEIMESIYKRSGWFTPYPLELSRKCFESEIPIYLWFIDLFEVITENSSIFDN